MEDSGGCLSDLRVVGSMCLLFGADHHNNAASSTFVISWSIVRSSGKKKEAQLEGRKGGERGK